MNSSKIGIVLFLMILFTACGDAENKTQPIQNKNISEFQKMVNCAIGDYGHSGVFIPVRVEQLPNGYVIMEASGLYQALGGPNNLTYEEYEKLIPSKIVNDEEVKVNDTLVPYLRECFTLDSTYQNMKDSIQIISEKYFGKISSGISRSDLYIPWKELNLIVKYHFTRKLLIKQDGNSGRFVMYDGKVYCGDYY